MQVWYTKGNGQMKYGGHCCNFFRENANTMNRVPLLPQIIDIVILRPKNRDQEEQPSLVSSDCFRVRRHVVEQYLRVLERFHPSFRNRQVTIDLEALRHDENVFNQFQSIAETEVPLDNPGPNHLNEDEDPNSTLATNGFVPHLGLRETERAAFESGLNVTEIVLSQPRLNPQSVNEHDKNLRCMIDAFPVLFPTGAADFHEQRRKELKVTA